VTTARTGEDGRVATLLLTVGFLALAGGVLAAHRAPATGYEVDIYGATPAAVWVACGVALASALVVALRSPRRVAAYLLGGGTFVVVAAMPLLRSYHYYGSADALTHLGWARDVAAAEYGPAALFYPATHTTAVLLEALGGPAITRSLMLVVLVVVAVFVVFVALTAWELTGDRATTAVAAFSACMLLPVNNISTHLHAHPVTLAILFSPVLLYLVARIMSAGLDGERGPRTVRQDTALFGLAAVGAVLLHPQLAFSMLVLLATITGVQYALRRSRPLSAVARTRSLGAQTALLGVAFLAWAAGRPRFRSSRANFFDNLGALLGGSGAVAGEVGERGASLTALGAGLPEVFTKVFLVSALYAALAALLVLLVSTGRLSAIRDRTRAFALCVAAGIVPLSVVTLVYLAANVGTQAFRYAGFVMVVATLLGAILLGRLVSDVDVGTPRLSRGVAGAVVAVGLLLSLAVVYPSPFIYKPTQHVTEAQLEGHAAAFEETPESSVVRGVRGGPWRFADATYGRQSDHARYGGLNGSEFGQGLAETIADDDWYVLVSAADRGRELRAYDELRYTRESFRGARTSPRTSRVMANGDVRLYYVPE